MSKTQIAPKRDAQLRRQANRIFKSLFGTAVQVVPVYHPTCRSGLPIMAGQARRIIVKHLRRAELAKLRKKVPMSNAAKAAHTAMESVYGRKKVR